MARVGIVLAIGAMTLRSGAAKGQTGAPGDAEAAGQTRAQPGASVPHVLILSTYERKSDSTHSQSTQIEEALRSRPGGVKIASDQLISASGMPDRLTPEFIDALAQVVRTKFRGTRFDLVVTIDTLAFEVMTGPARDVVGSAPVVFSGLTWEPERVAALGIDATGVLERVDVPGTFALIRSTLPRTRAVLIVGRGTGFADRLAAEVKPQVDGAKGNLDVRWATAKTADELWKEVDELPQDGAVVYLAFPFVSTIMQREPDPAQLWKRPVFGVYETGVEAGLTGGRVISGAMEGRAAGAMAARVLNGERALSIPVSRTEALRTVMREPEMARWGITPESLPAGAEIIDRPAPARPLSERIRDVWDWAVAACVVLAGLIVLLAYNLRRSRRAEEEAHAAGEMFRSTFERAAVGMSNVTIEGKWLMVNDRLCQMLGRDRQTLLGLTFSELTHPDDIQENLDVLRRALEGERDSYALEKRYLRPDGSIVWGHVTASLVRDKQGRAIHIISVVQDITDRKQAEAELEESKRLLEQAQSVGRIGSWISDGVPGGRVVWSDEVSRIFGLTAETFDGRSDSFWARVHPDDRALARQMVDDALAGRRPYNFDHRIVRPDGQVRWVHEQAEIIRDAQGGILRMVGVTQDVTERAEAERFGAAQRRVLEMMAAGAPLQRTVEAIVWLTEEQCGPGLGTVLRLDERGRMWTVSAHSLPGAYCASLDGVQIGPGVGSCGTAMHEKRRVVSADIDLDPLWASHKHKALAHGLRACWSEPIVASDGRVLGSLALYFKEPRRPTERELSVMTTAAHLAGIAMERARIEEARDRSETTRQALLNAMPDVMFRVNREGVYLDYHKPDVAPLLVPPEKFLGRRVEDVLPKDRADPCVRALEQLFATGEPQAYEYDVRRADGSHAWWEVRVVRAGEDEAMLLLRDVTKPRVAERRLRESEERLRLLVETTPLGVVQWGLDFTVRAWNPGAERIFGHSAGEALGRHSSFIVPESARRYVNDEWRNLLANKGGFRSSNRNVRKDGSLIWSDWYNSPLVDAAGKIIGVASVVEDVTERRLAQQRQDFMMAELDHRVKNNLAAVISLAEQTGRSAQGYREFLDKFMGRVRAMSRMHSVLARSRWQAADLRTLVTQTLEAFGSGSAGRATVSGQSVMLGPRAAQAMAMALNELATNAVKYGVLSVAGGTVDVAWTSEGADQRSGKLLLRWMEKGGPEVHAPSRRGFGSQLIEGAIGYELRGKVTLEFAPTGVVCNMVVPLTEEMDAASEKLGPLSGRGAEWGTDRVDGAAS